MLLRGVAASGGWAAALFMLAVALKTIGPKLLDYLSGRSDARLKALADREDRVDKSLAKRLAALERQLAAGQKELRNMASLVGRYHKATVILAAEIRIVSPSSAALDEVKELLELAFPPVVVFAEMPMDLEELAVSAEEAIRREGGNNV